MQWPEPWEPITPNEQQSLDQELQRELSAGHPLHTVRVKAIARRFDRDDVLFAIEGSSSVAVVHLSYGTEAGPLWPHTQIFNNLSEWKTKVDDRDEWSAEDRRDATQYSLGRASKSFGEE